nr:O-antigen ligase family protein [Clostridium sp. D53t1_180928_C8]
MGVILGVKVFIIKKSRLAYKIILIIAIMITILSGSRNAFLGLIGSLVIVYIINAKREGRIIGRLMKMMIIGSVLMIIGLIILPSFGIDLARFNYVELAESGGTNRMTLWKKVIELIIQKYMLFGYGPGHYCSSLIVSPLVNRNYAHTHNLFIEAWGELGLFGLIPFVILILITFKKCFKKYKLGLSGLMLLGIFLEMIINCIGEAHFCDIVLWIIIGSIWAYSRKGNYRIE